jgi:hypothetical protein
VLIYVREKYCWLVVGGWFVLREKYCCLVADKPNEQAISFADHFEEVGEGVPPRPGDDVRSRGHLTIPNSPYACPCPNGKEKSTVLGSPPASLVSSYRRHTNSSGFLKHHRICKICAL